MEVFEAADKVAYRRTDQTRPEDLAGARMRAGTATAAADADLLYTKLLPETLSLTLTESETGERKDEPNWQTDEQTDTKGKGTRTGTETETETENGTDSIAFNVFRKSFGFVCFRSSSKGNCQQQQHTE